MTLGEAAFLWRHGRASSGGVAVEIGRFKGGATFLLAASLRPPSRLYSYDLGVKLAGEPDHRELDGKLTAALERAGLADRVTLVVGDSRTVEPPPEPVDLILVDGDHSCAGVRADYEHWIDALAPGGSMLFHDAYDSGVARFLTELDMGGALEKVGQVGTLAHYRRAAAVSDAQSPATAAAHASGV